ncbi:hypothetical protein JXB41_03365 [Candidatus Woesearchaeota archaeon]|nr:hypothetical protein [Candidatus Woesearchaeota archaeon]
MTKTILFVFLLSMILITSCAKSAEITEKTGETEFESQCPKGLINDPFPGSCALYTDENNNRICDYSEVN